MTEYAIELRQIVFSYSSSKRLFDKLDWKVRRNTITGLVGENGSGKTTLVHLALSLLKAENGTLVVDGKLVENSADVKESRKRIGFLFQDSDSQLFSLTVSDDIAFGVRNMGLADEEVMKRVDSVLSKLGISHLKDRIIQSLSGGEKRLVALCTILAMNPEIIILDEPTICLDPKGKKNLCEIIKSIDCTIVLLSHDMEFVRSACSHVQVLSAGKIIAEGLADEVLSNKDAMHSNGLEVPYSLR